MENSINEKKVVKGDMQEFDFVDLIIFLKHKVKIFLAAGLAGVIIAGLVTLLVLTPQYASTAKLYILTQSTSITSLADIQLGSSLATDYVELIKGRPLVEEVIKQADVDYEFDELVDHVEITNKPGTRILEIKVYDENSEVAMNLANTFANISKVKIAEIMQTSEPILIEEAICAEKPETPNTVKNIIAGLVLGMIAACLYYVCAYIFGSKIRKIIEG